jgi:exocyst complex component 4
MLVTITCHDDPCADPCSFGLHEHGARTSSSAFQNQIRRPHARRCRIHHDPLPATSPTSIQSRLRPPMSRDFPDSLRGGYGNGGRVANGYGSNIGGTNPYGSTNPYGDTNPPYGDNDRSGETRGSRPAFRARERRQGGYGAGTLGSGDAPTPFGFAGSRENILEEGGPQVNRPTSLERSQAKRRSGGIPYAQRSPTRRQFGDGSKQIEEVLSYIKRDWDFMTEEKCVPVQVALQLMDNSSLGLASRYPQFRDIHQQLQNALRAIVNEHHQGFNSSIGTFHNIQNAIQTSQQKLRGLKESLVLAKSSLSTTKPELKGLATSSQNYDDMLQVLSSMLVHVSNHSSKLLTTCREHLQGIPEKLEARISEKRFLSAVELLQDALKTMRNPEMDKIGALSDLRVYLSNQEHVCD